MGESLAGGLIFVVPAVILLGQSLSLPIIFIVGGTSKRLEISMMIAVIVSAMQVGLIILMLNQAYTLGSDKVPAPQAVLKSIIVKGIMSSQIPWALVIIGVSTGILIGGIVKYLIVTHMNLYMTGCQYSSGHWREEVIYLSLLTTT